MARRSKPGKNIIFGHHPVAEAIEAGASLEKVLLRRGHKPERVVTLAREHHIPLQFVPEITLDKLAPQVNHQGIVAMVSAIRYHKLEDLLLQLQDTGLLPLLVMLDGVTDVRNFGAIVRTAECLGAQGVIVPSQGSAAANGDAVKASAGALHHLPICREDNLVDAILLMQAYEIQSVGITEKAGDLLYDMDFQGPSCLIMGSEERGISSSLLKRADHLAKIPMLGKVESLNVSVAAGMALSEVARQRA